MTRKMECVSATPTKRKRRRPPKKQPTEDSETSPSKRRVVEGRKVGPVEVSHTKSRTLPHTLTTRTRLRNEWREQIPPDTEDQYVQDDNDLDDQHTRNDLEPDYTDDELRIVEDSDKENPTVQELIVLLDDFDLFADHPKYTLLHNLFDLTKNVGCSCGDDGPLFLTLAEIMLLLLLRTYLITEHDAVTLKWHLETTEKPFIGNTTSGGAFEKESAKKVIARGVLEMIQQSGFGHGTY
ncbi:hypothetical protein BJ742DRAFT_735409 [Cladochytrium replicatum]|nr:hypothetical protein BJ742DRAFT_735409 [Cladochytrium replicatum]